MKRFPEIVAGLVCLMILAALGAGFFLAVDLQTREDEDNGSWVAEN